MGKSPIYHLLPRFVPPNQPPSRDPVPPHRSIFPSPYPCGGDGDGDGEATGDASLPPPRRLRGLFLPSSNAYCLHRAFPAHAPSARRARLQGPGRLPQKRAARLPLRPST
ncbi:hypothetical protein PVAP13_2KG145332 [Panicum virgatum]|uniref:Uncharacterized protein n=1 Tax=Panicum virgatum TaxID=38727 RepID=A0A8T0W6S3_PANVG|nr:hypothetical protein PVAP13_2KG145332 [Panicum virgatum]